MDSTFSIIAFTRIYLAIFFTGVAVFYTLRIITRKRSTAAELVFPGKSLTATWWNHMLFRGFRFTIWMVCLLRWPYPALDSYLGIIDPLYQWPVVLAGDILLTAGFLTCIAVHFSLGAQWRSGIDPKMPETLKTDGFYRFSRNPMFLAIAAAQAGFFLALPSVFSALCLAFGLYTLRRQTMAEEEHLTGRFPEAFQHYRSHVRRWL